MHQIRFPEGPRARLQLVWGGGGGLKRFTDPTEVPSSRGGSVKVRGRVCVFGVPIAYADRKPGLGCSVRTRTRCTIQ